MEVSIFSSPTVKDLSKMTWTNGLKLDVDIDVKLLNYIDVQYICKNSNPVI